MVPNVVRLRVDKDYSCKQPLKYEFFLLSCILKYNMLSVFSTQTVQYHITYQKTSNEGGDEDKLEVHESSCRDLKHK